MGRKTKMNSITSPELLAQVNPENTQLLEDFKDYLRSVQRSETTIAGYENDIQIAFVWCLQHNNNAFFVNWTKRNIVAYQNWLLNSNENSPARVRRLKASLSSMSNFVVNIFKYEFTKLRNIINIVENPANNFMVYLHSLLIVRTMRKPAILPLQCIAEDENPNCADLKFLISMRINSFVVALCIKAIQSKQKVKAAGK